ncbi:MAG TPA: GTPase domain-containing protein, partial [Thermoanaerobaculia bacterium]
DQSAPHLRQNLAEISLSIDEIPLILQINKRDLPNIAPVDDVLDIIDPERKYDWVEAVASRGDGVFETLKMISKLTLRTLRRRMTGEEPAKPTPRRPSTDSSFRVREDVATPPPPPDSRVSTAPIAAYNPQPTQQIAEPFDELSTDDEIEIPPMPAIAEPPIVHPEPPPDEIAAPEPVPEPAAAAPEPEIDFSQTEKQVKGEPDVKHVKVRSSIDIMAELESLRKRATQSAPKPATKKETSPLDALRHPPKPKRDVHRTVTLPMAPGALAKSKQLRVTVSFENDSGVVQRQEQSLDLGETSDIQSLSVNLKFEDL